MLFSERHGYKKVRDVIQIESMDQPLRNGLWTVLKLLVWDNVRDSDSMYRGVYLSAGNDEMQALCSAIWISYFKKPIDTLNDDWDKTLQEIRRYFFGCEWNEALDFIEFVGRRKREGKGVKSLLLTNSLCLI